MDLTKSYEFYQPEKCKGEKWIIGCGAIGSTIAENLVRLGHTDIVLCDFDTVEEKNIANQMFRSVDINKPKVEALKEILCEVNPELEKTIRLEPEGYTDQKLSGYIFLAVDSIKTRREIVESLKINMSVKGIFDFRMRLTDAQHYAADWNDLEMRDNLLESMNFTDEEAIADTPVSACNQMLSVAPTIRTICAFGISNFMNFAQGKGIKKLILIDAFNYTIDAF